MTNQFRRTFAAVLFAGTLIAQNQTPTHIAYAGDTAAGNHQKVSLRAMLTDGRDGPVQDGDVTFTLGNQNCTGVPDKSGKAGCSLLLNQPAGKYTLKIAFGGSRSLYAGSASATVDFVIK